MIRTLLVLLYLTASTTISYAQNPGCEDPASHCSRSLSRQCLERVGAGSAAPSELQPAANGADCETQLLQYRECLSNVLTQCDQGERQAPAPAQSQCTPFREQTLYEAAQADPAKLEMLAAICPESPLIALLRDQKDTLTKEKIRTAQAELRRLKLYTGPIDGEWSESARIAFRAFQRHSGLPADGELTEASLAGLQAAKAPQPPLTNVDPATLSPGQVFQECEVCPAMVIVPAGSFLMGSPESEGNRHAKEGPRHNVEIQRFALGRTEVTLSQWRRFLASRGNSKRPCDVSVVEGDKIYGRTLNVAQGAPLGLEQPEIYPAGCITREDATEYAAWLNDQVSGAPYRLPTEAEWEYAARAGSGEEYAWGAHPNAGCSYGNIADNSFTARFTQWDGLTCDDGHSTLAPVGMYRPNAFGLYDMFGNLSEVTQDCMHESYQNAPADGSAWMEEDGGKCHDAVLRGGSWLAAPFWLRASSRTGAPVSQRFSEDGLRIARTLKPQ